MRFDKKRVFLRVNFLIQQLSYLKEYELISFETYLNKFEKKATIERTLELMIQAAIDINKHLITQQLRLPFPTTAKDSFLQLGQKKILTEDLAANLAKSAGLRNVLAHEYLEIDDKIIYQSIPLALTQYPLYIQQIITYLDSLD
ncbi:type VII toxin-antitoxin system HepT family RNase toxin [Crocosphaera sp.]|uniref:type VII toxin-antitoxin system HepT family RNase toxin n=1 Tax=Crocosphaera sp. TaxID=2729996 RepID=UPI003F2513E3